MYRSILYLMVAIEDGGVMIWDAWRNTSRTVIGGFAFRKEFKERLLAYFAPRRRYFETSLRILDRRSQCTLTRWHMLNEAYAYKLPRS